MKTARDILCIALLTSLHYLYVVPVNAQTSNCPPCYNDQAHITARWGNAADGRQRVNVWVDESNMSSTEVSKIRQGAPEGYNNWNNAADAQGNKIPYNFQPAPNAASTDFIVKKETAEDGCADINLSSYPYVIRIDPYSFQNGSANCIANIIAHELGHRIGLDNADNCPPATSVMGGHDQNCCPLSSVKPADVGQANRSYSTPNTCTATAPSTASGGGGSGDGGGGDEGGGGGCSDCNCSYQTVYTYQSDPAELGEGCYRKYRRTEYVCNGIVQWSSGNEYEGIVCDPPLL